MTGGLLAIHLLPSSARRFAVFCVSRRVDLGIDPLYYREVVFATQFEFMCYTVEDAVDWLSTPTA